MSRERGVQAEDTPSPPPISNQWGGEQAEQGAKKNTTICVKKTSSTEPPETRRLAGPSTEAPAFTPRASRYPAVRSAQRSRMLIHTHTARHGCSGLIAPASHMTAGDRLKEEEENPAAVAGLRDTEREQREQHVLSSSGNNRFCQKQIPASGTSGALGMLGTSGTSGALGTLGTSGALGTLGTSGTSPDTTPRSPPSGYGSPDGRARGAGRRAFTYAAWRRAIGAALCRR